MIYKKKDDLFIIRQNLLNSPSSVSFNFFIQFILSPLKIIYSRFNPITAMHQESFTISLFIPLLVYASFD